MTEATGQVVEQLETVVSLEKGFGLLWSQRNDLTDDLVRRLEERARELSASGDVFGAREFERYAEEARSIVTSLQIHSAPVQGAGECHALLEGKRDRLDDAFVDFTTKVASSHLESLRSLLDHWAPESARSESAKEQIEVLNSQIHTAYLKTGLLLLVSQLTGKPDHKAKAALIHAEFLALRCRFEEIQGKLEKANQLYDLAVGVLKQCSEDQMASASLRARVLCLLANMIPGEKEDAIQEHFLAAERLLEQADDQPLLHQVRRKVAWIARLKGDWKGAFDRHEKSIKETEDRLWKTPSPMEGMELVRATLADYEAVLELYLEKGSADSTNFERALEFAERAKACAFSTLLGKVRFNHGRVPPRLHHRRNAILDIIEKLRRKIEIAPDLKERYIPKMTDLQNALKANETEIEKHAAHSLMDLSALPCRFDEMVKLVPPGGAILSYFSLPEQLVLFVLNKDGLAGPPVQIPVSRQKLYEAVLFLQLQLRIRQDIAPFLTLQQSLDPPGDSFQPRRALRDLYRQLIEPVRDRISGLSPLYIVPHGSLRSIPFQALMPADNAFLVDEFALAYTPSISVLNYCVKRRRREFETCFAAGASANLGGPELAWAEAEAVARHFKTSPRPATRDTVLNEAGECDVIHLACHSDDVSALTAFQGLRLEDGTLFQRDIAAMTCRASLVTLSACSTAEADQTPQPGAEMAGLIGAFIRAGCPSVVASLWPVADEAALPMMEAFYGALRKENTHKAEALRQAQLAVKRERGKGFDHPYFWAPFCLWGDI